MVHSMCSCREKEDVFGKDWVLPDQSRVVIGAGPSQNCGGMPHRRSHGKLTGRGGKQGGKRFISGSLNLCMPDEKRMTVVVCSKTMRRRLYCLDQAIEIVST
jgi:hypothetical protein